MNLRRGHLVLLCACLSFLRVNPAGALKISNHYSHWNGRRPKRKKTEYIILHTTEGPRKGSLDKVRRNGETHYFVDTEGRVYRIISRDRVALHAGRSMWRGKTDLDSVSLGIEVVGYHNRPITSAQVAAVRELLGQLQRIYGVPDERVLTHSMVAYGTPNRWHRRSHRGRKRCGMLFARRSTRNRLGLTRQPTYDPDVKTGRLAVGDPALARVLYGGSREQAEAVERFSGGSAHLISATRSAWDIAREKYNSPNTLYVFPDGKKLKGNQVKDWKKVPAGTKVVMAASQRGNAQEKVVRTGNGDRSALDIAGEEHNKATTIYFYPDGKVRRGDELKKADFKSMPTKTGVLVGYVHGGYITAKRSAFDVCGERWRLPSTVYRFPDGSMQSGNRVKENAIPKGTLVFFRQ